MFLYKTLPALVVTTGITLAPLTALAQTTPAPFGGRGNIDEQSIYHPPEAYVLKADGKLQQNGTVQGSVTFWNKSEEILGDMTYVIELLGELPPAMSNQVVEDTAPVYDMFTSTDRFVLVGGEQKTIPYTYIPPKNLPAGNYRIEITVSNGRGRTLGWYDVPIRIEGNTNTFAQLFPGDIKIPEYKDETFAAESGPNVQPEKSFQLTAITSSPTNKTVIPVLDIYPFSPSRQRLRTIQTPRIQIGSEPETFTMNVPAAKEAGVYIGMLSLKDAATGTVISNLAKYRWVVRGAGADVLHVRLQSYENKKGEVVSFAVDYVGAADAETKTTGTITAELRDSQGILGSVTDANTPLTDQINTGEATITLPRDIQGEAVLNITIRGEKENTLASYRVPFPLTEQQLKTLENKTLLSQVLVYGGIGVAIAGVLFLAITYFSKKPRRKKR